MNYIMLKDICAINMGQSPDSNSYNDEGYGLPFFQGNADFGERYPIAKKWCSAPQKIAKPEDILISVRAPIGAVNYAKEKCCIGRGLAAITLDKSKVSKEFIFWLLKSKNQELNNKGVGSTFKSIGRKVLEETLVPDLTKEKQMRYSEILEKLYFIIQSRMLQQKELDELVKARFVEMFGEEKNKVKMVDICSIITDGTHESPKFVNEGIPFIFVSNISDNKIMYDADKYIDKATYDVLIKRTPIEIGDIILSTVGSYGHPAVVKSDKKFLFQRHIAYLKPKREMVNSEYLHTMIMMDYVQHQINLEVKGIAQKTLNLSAIKSLDVLMPSLSQQNEFAFFKNQVDKSKSVIEKSLKELETLQASLMQKYFS